MSEEQNRFSLRKLSVGLASVLIGVSIFGTSQTVKADTVANNQTSSVTNNAKSSDTQENKNVAKSSFSNDNQANNAKSNLIQTQVEAKKDPKQDSVPKTQEVNDSSNLDAEKSIVRTSSLQEPDNQSNNHAEDNSQTQNEQKLDLTKNSPKFAKKVLATNLIATPPMTNGGFDPSWGTLDVNDWQGSVQGDYYQLTDYTGDANHVIVPNEADFAKAGISTSGKQVGVTRDLMHTIFRDKTTAQDATFAFSKTDNKQIKAIGDDWNDTWGHKYYYDSKAKLSKFDGTNLDVSNVTNMSDMFSSNRINDLSSLANWKVDNVTNMGDMFEINQINDISPLANWKTANVTDMNGMFSWNKIIDLSPLTNWKVDNVTNMGKMFKSNQVSDLNPLANWKVDNVTNMGEMFKSNQVSDLNPLANWKVDNVTNMNGMFDGNQISDVSPLANWKTDNVTNMISMFRSNHISDLSPLANWKVNNVTNMGDMFSWNNIIDLSPLTNWKVNNVTNMNGMFRWNNIIDLSPLTNWKVDNGTNMNGMFDGNQISDVSPLANWKVDNVTDMNGMFDDNSSTQTKNLQAKRVINFAYPDGYTGKTQDPVTQTIDVPQRVKVELITKDSKPSNNILDWVTIKETPEASDPVYFLDYTVPTVANLVPSISTVSKTQADPNKPINVTVTYTAAPVTVHFVDTDENADKDTDAIMQELDKTASLTGKYGDTIDLSNVKLPANFVIDDTSSDTFGNTTDVYINLKHQHAKSTAQAPATRTIVVHMPDGTTKTYVQTIGFVNNLDKDLVTNKTTNIYTVDASKSNVTVNGTVDSSIGAYRKTGNDDANGTNYKFASFVLPKIPGYKAHLVRNKLNPAMLMVSFMAVPSENKPSLPNEETPSKPSAPADNPNKPAGDLQQRVVTELNNNDSGWTMPETSSTYTVEVPADDVIDLSDLVIAEPIHAHTHTQIRVNKRFKLSKKHSIKHLKHRKKAVRQFKKYRL